MSAVTAIAALLNTALALLAMFQAKTLPRSADPFVYCWTAASIRAVQGHVTLRHHVIWPQLNMARFRAHSRSINMYGGAPAVEGAGHLTPGCAAPSPPQCPGQKAGCPRV